MNKESAQPIKAEQLAIARAANAHAAHNGGREYTHDVDGIPQYPDLLQFDPVNTRVFTIVVNLEIRKHS